MRGIVPHCDRCVLRIVYDLEFYVVLGVGYVGVVEGVGDVDCDAVSRLQGTEMFVELGGVVVEVVLVADGDVCRVVRDGGVVCVVFGGDWG